MGFNQRMPPKVLEVMRHTNILAGLIHKCVASSCMNEGLYVAIRSRRDPINMNRKRQYLTVRLRQDGVEVFRSEEALNTFPTEHLIARLMLVS